MPMKSLLLTLLFVTHAAAGMPESTDQGNRTCRVLFLGRSAEVPKEAYLFDGTTSQKVSLPTNNFSEVVQLPDGELTLRLYAEPVSELEKSGGKAPAVAVAVEADVIDFFLLVENDPSNSVIPVKMEVIDISNGQLELGQTLWINQTAHNISAELGDKTILIPPRQRAIAPPPLEKSGYYKAQFKYQREAKDEFLPLMRKSWWFDNSSRNMGFIVDTGARLPKVFTIRDHR